MADYQSGQSLVEFMLLLSISLFIVGAVFKLVVLVRNEMQYEFAQSNLMQSLLVSEYQLQEQVQSSGLASCGQISSLLSYRNLAKDVSGRVRLAQGTSVQAFHLNQVDELNLDKPGSGQAASDTDVLIVRKTSASHYSLDQPLSKTARSIKVAKSFKIKAKQILLIASCEHLVSDKVIAVWQQGEHQVIALKSPIGFNFKAGDVLSQYEFAAYYVGKTLRKGNDGKFIKALYFQDSQAIRHELVPDVSKLLLHSFSNSIEAEITVQSESLKLSKHNKMLLTWN
jgi:hypothetical protein